MVWFVCSGYGICRNIGSWGYCRCKRFGYCGRLLAVIAIMVVNVVTAVVAVIAVVTVVAVIATAVDATSTKLCGRHGFRG